MIESWVQELVGIDYVEKGETPEQGFYCIGLCRYIIQKKYDRQLPDDPESWRSEFIDLGWPVEVEPYDLLLLDYDGLHMAVAADENEAINAALEFGQVVIQPMRKLAPFVRTVFRLKRR